jgi:ATP-dependent Lon protease
MIKEARKRSRPVEDQIRERYGSYLQGVSKDVSSAQKEKSQYYFENEHLDDQMFN